MVIFVSWTTKKHPDLRTSGCFALREVSMKQNPIPSQTTSRLYQHPTVEEQRPSRLATIKANVIDFIIFIVVSFILWVIAVTAASWMMGG